MVWSSADENVRIKYHAFTGVMFYSTPSTIEKICLPARLAARQAGKAGGSKFSVGYGLPVRLQQEDHPPET